MLGKRSPQHGMFAVSAGTIGETDQQYLDFVGENTFYGFLARHGSELFQDEDFADLYCDDNGRPSVPPSLLAIALLLQAHDGVSDEEAKARADYDMRWKVALGVELDERPFAKSTLQLFCSQLILHEKEQAIFLRSLKFTKEQSYLTGGRGNVALDTTPILGRGAVKDTYNLLTDGITIVQTLCWKKLV
ncbi:MAG: transposase [Anaerolineales bacterium]|nr:transposase [Anaerolineales bacterium]